MANAGDLTATGSKFNMLLWADSDNSGDGINMVSAHTVNTNGGSLQFGHDETATINGQTVRVGGDVYFSNGGAAQTVSTGGGNVDVFGETIVSNAAGLTIDSAGGNIRFRGLLNSGNQYTWVDKTGDTAHDWDWARADAKNGTAGGASLGDSYLVTITSRLENAIAGLTAGYRGAWIGAYRPSYSSGAWVWANGPESGKQFFTQTTNGSGGTTASGYYSNFGSGEPNGCMSAATCEGVGQFFGTAGQWNDLARTTQFSSTQASIYAVLGYVRETNLAPSPITISSGSGTVTFDGNVGASKALASVNISGTGTATLPAVVTTKGTQTYGGPVALVQNTTLTTTNSDIAFNSTVNSADAAHPKDLTINIVPDTAYYWVNWTSSDANHVYGTITIGGDVIGVTYTNTQGYSFVQTSSSITKYNAGSEVFTNYWSQTQDAHAYDGVTYVSPYVSARVANGPTTANLVALRYAGSQTLTFSQPVENLAFSIMSLNGNGYGFNQDFNIESYTGLNGAASGFYGTGTFTKTSSGSTYNLNGTIGEPHGTIRFANAFNQLTWTSLSNEYWNGFTVGVTGTSATAGKVRFNGVAGGSAALGAVIVNGQMKTTANIADAGSLSVSGLSNLGGNITTAGNQNYQSAVTLSTDATLTTTNNGSVSTTSTIDGAHSLTINTNGTGDTALEGAVGGTTALTGLSVTTDVLSAKAIALANSAALSVTNSGASVISGVISGVATTLTKAGDGTLTLTGANTYTGATTIDAGTLRVLGDTSSAANTTSGYSGSGGALLIEPVSTSFSGAFTFNKPVSGSLSALTIGKSTNTADITLDGAISVAGPISVYGGTVAANASLSTTSASTGDVLISASTGLSGSGNIALADGRTLTVDQAGSTIYNGAISGTDANFVKNGVGDLGLGGASTYGGGTTVNTGVLSLAAADRLPDTTALTVAANGTFSLNGFNETVGSISGSGLIVNGAVVRDGLVLWLDAGNAASYDGTLVGAPTYNAATSLFSFTDNTQYVQLAALPANFLGGTVTGLTVFTVANFGPTADSWERVVDLGNAPSPINTPSNNIILARNGTTNRLGWEYYNGVNAGATYTSIGANTAITNNVKGSYVGTADGSNLRIYRDGVLNTTTASTALPNAIARSSNFIGKSNWAQDDTFRGDIGTLMIYNRALSAAEIAKNHQLLFNRSTATLTTGGSNADTTFSGKIENGVSTLNLVKQGSGTLTLSGSNGYTGSTTVGGGTLKIENDAPASATLTSGFVGSGGALAIVPSGTSFSGAYSFNRPMSGSFSGLLIGKAGNTAAIAMDEAVSIAGDIALIGGDLTLNQQLESTGSHTVTLNASGNVTDGASGYLSADKLLLQGGNVTLDNASNAVGTLAASGVSGLTYLDSDALTVGAVGSTNGISASGAVSVATSNGDLTVAQDVATTNATAAAIVLNAGKSAAAGTAAGGNLIVSGSPAITTGTGGRATLYSGSVSGSTGLADLVGSGSGRFRYGSDEAASNFAAALGSGLYAIYREQPALTLTVADQTVTYGDALPTYTGTVTGGSIVNGDSGYRLVGRVDSTGGYIKAGSYTIDAQGLIDLGYAVTQTTGTLTVNRLALAGSISAGSSVYGAALSAGTASFSNVLAGDLLGTASVAVATSGHTSSSGHLQAGSYSGAQSIAALSGADGGNYSFSTVTGDYTVSQLVLSVSGITASNKVYDGNATAAVSTTGAVLGNLVSGDDVTMSATGSFADKNIGSGKTVTLTSSYGGADLGNYTVTDQASTTASISARALTISGITAANKVYDGNATAAVNTASPVLGNLVAGDDVTVSATGAFANKNVGAGKTVTLTSSYGGADLGNYTVTDQASAAASITSRALTISGITAANKVYDGNATAAVSIAGAVLGNLVAGDDVTMSATGAFADKNVGSGKTVTLSSTYGGADLGNYTVTGQASTTASISARALTVSGITAANKVYDGNATAAVNTAGAVLGNLVAGDDVTVSAAGAFADKNVGTGKTVTLTSSYGGADLGNYAVAGQAGTTADITPKTLTVVGLAASGKTYDGTAGVSITDWGHVDTGVGSETLVLRASGAAFDDANAGTGKTVTASGYAVSDGANGGVASNYRLSAASATTTADIARAALTVTANDDAKFVTQTDASGYNGVQYSGFVHGEDASALGGSLTLSRTNASQNAAGTYRDVLVPAGLTGGNYDISYAAGSYTIVPAEQLLIRFDNASTTYGAAPTYSLASVQYMDSGNAIRTLSGSQSGNTFTYSDGVGGSVSFTVAPQGAATTGAGRLAVGNYALGDSAPTITGSNFSALLFTGNLAVTQKAVAPVVSGVSKVYDGTTGMEGAAIAISGTLSGDAVAVSGNGAFAQKNVGSGVAYTISNLALDGADSANYYLSGGSTFSDNNGVIIARPVTVSGITAGSKTYDGNATAALDMSGVQLANLVVGDNLTISATGAFADKNVGIGKTVAITSTYGGADVGNYVITNQATTAADIARLASVTWIGGAGGNWFDPANWAGGAVPDLSNVANVVIPSGVVVSFDTTGAVSPAQTGPVHIDGLGNSGGLSQSNGELHVGAGGVTLDSYSQSGGILTSVGPITLNSFAQTGGSTATQGNFNVNGDFSQGPNGTVDVGGNANITDTHGGTTLGNLTVAGNANVTSTDGDITQAGGTAVTVAGTTTLSATRGGKPADIVLGNAGNDFGGPVNASGRHITLTDHAGGLTLGTINASGDFNATSTGGPIGQSGGGIVTVGGTTSLDASSAGQPADITLANGGNTFNGPFNATGANILLNAAGGLTFGTVFSQGNVQVAALGDIGQTIGGSFTVSGGGIFQSLNGVIHLDSANNTFGGGLQTLDTSNTDQTHVIAPVPQPVPLPTATDAAPLSASFPTSTGEGGGAAGGPLAQATAGASEGAAGGASAASPASTPTVSESTAGASAGVVVELRTVPTESQSGLITVSLPKGASGSPAGFSFPLPEQVVSTATPEATITASLPNGAPLPTWLRFDPASRSFIASVVPTDALPISVIVTVGNIQTTVVVTEREE